MALCKCKICLRVIDCDPDQLCELCATDLLPGSTAQSVADPQAGDERMEIFQMADSLPTDKPFRSVCKDADCGCRSKKAAAKSPGWTFDEGKAPLALLPRLPLELVADVFGKGASKYAMHNWRAGIQITRNLSCALRHIYAYNEGEDLDPELGTNHLANAIVRLMFVLETAVKHPEMDDRWREGNRADIATPWVEESKAFSVEVNRAADRDRTFKSGNATVSVPAGTTGTFEDVTNCMEEKLRAAVLPVGPSCLACGQPMTFEYVMPDGATGHYYCGPCKFPRDYPMQGKTAYD